MPDGGRRLPTMASSICTRKRCPRYGSRIFQAGNEMLLTCTLAPVPEGTRLTAEFEPTPHGLFRLAYPLWLGGFLIPNGKVTATRHE